MQMNLGKRLRHVAEDWAAPSGLSRLYLSSPQGVALGWHRSGLWPSGH
jgi:hypothetical protein